MSASRQPVRKRDIKSRCAQVFRSDLDRSIFFHSEEKVAPCCQTLAQEIFLFYLFYVSHLENLFNKTQIKDKI